jgi:hypothetical protein
MSKPHFRALLALCLFCCATAQAEPPPLPSVVGLHLRSVHADNGKAPAGSYGWNDNNAGAYARWRNGFTVGAFRNSLDRNSAYVGWTLSDNADRFSVTLAALSGYDKLTDGPGDHQAVRCDKANGCRRVALQRVILPVIVPSVRLGLTNHLSARISAIAPPGQPAAVHFSLEWKQ